MAGPFFRQLRLAELADTEQLLRRHGGAGARVLEIGSGTGWQARALAGMGYAVEAIDLPRDAGISNHAAAREWPITDYDGAHIPFPDAHFDVIYSSNVLEHVVELETLTAEMHRVLRPGGVGVHLLPNPQWRLLSLLTYYPAQAIDGLRYARRRLLGSKTGTTPPEAGAPSSASSPAAPGIAAKIVRRLLPPTHGSRGTPLGELSRFSRAQWDDYFARTGWRIVQRGNNGILASGDYLLGSLFPLALRRIAGRLAGGIAHVYVVQAQGGEGR